MKVEWICPTIMILMSIGSAIAYGWQGDIRRTIYWLSASVLTASVTF